MSFEQNCIFCKIIKGDIPSAKVYEDEHVLAFMDISQVTKGHTLVIPKVHQANIFELSPDVASHLFSVIPTIATALKETFNPLGLNLVNNNGEVASQTVFHYHIHLIPRYDKDDDFGFIWKDHSGNYSTDDLSNMAKKVVEQIKN